MSNEVLIWKKDTWGSFGQHSNLYTFVIDVENLTTKAIFEYDITVRHENNDSRKNIHRATYAEKHEIIEKLRGKVLKIVCDYKSSSKRSVTVDYYYVDSDLLELDAERGLRDSRGFFDRVKLPNGRTLIVRKDSVEIC